MSIPSQASILVVSASPSDASQVVEQLRAEFSEIRAATAAGDEVKDFEAALPDVLILAYRDLAQAQEYLIGLFRLGTKARLHSFRTILLCSKESVAAAYELCKKAHFDDYVLYWPMAYEGSRLNMSVWVAIRGRTPQAEGPTAGELRAHVEALALTASTARNAFEEGRARISQAQDSVGRAESNIDAALEELRRQVSQSNSPGAGDAGELQQWSERIQALQKAQIQPVLRAATQSIEPIASWVENFQSRLNPALQGARGIAGKVAAMRPVILVVEDDPLAQTIVKAALTGSRYSVTFASDGPEALRILQRQLPDLILMDVKLPGMDGVTITKILKASPQFGQIPVVMLTGDARAETVAESVSAGAASFLVKPFTRAALMNKLDRYVQPSKGV